MVKGEKGEAGSEWTALVSFRAVLSGYERVDGGEFAVEGCGNVFVFVIGLVVEEGDGGVWVWLFWLVKVFDCVPEFVLVSFVVE